MSGLLLSVAERLWPELADMPLERQAIGVGEVLTVLYAGPLALLGLASAASVTELQLMRDNFGIFLLLAVLLGIFNRYQYFLVARLRESRFGSVQGSLEGVVLWSGLLIFGPSVIWLSVFWSGYDLVGAWTSGRTPASRWRALRSGTLDLAGGTIAPLGGLAVYRLLGGSFPLRDLSLQSLAIGLAGVAAHMLIQVLLLLGYLLYHVWVQRRLLGLPDALAIYRFFSLGIALPHLAHPFGVLAAGVFVENGELVYLFMLAGALMVAALARELSWAAERSRQQTRVMRELEQLGNAVINSPPEKENLTDILGNHLPGMFPSGNLLVWTFPDVTLHQSPKDWNPDLRRMWPWLVKQVEAAGFIESDQLPWTDPGEAHNPLIIAPILDAESLKAIGGCYLDLHTLSHPWTRRSVDALSPGLHSLATLIGSALNRSRSYSRFAKLQRVSQELQLAGSIQSSFMPYELPQVPGWQIAVALKPAGETSGDFFDVIPLSDGKVGLVIADVLDKGIGAALYMALSRTLIRTYALETDAQPGVVLYAANERILSDTTSDLFVTVFFSVLDVRSGRLTYSNAGHNPPFLVQDREGMVVQELIRTGVPVGVQQGATWEQHSVSIHPGDFLILYTDGIPEAQNRSGEFFSAEMLLEIAKENLGSSAEMMQTQILQKIQNFVDSAPQSDDITLMVLARDTNSPA